MRSMTGFGLSDAPLGAGRLVVEVRTVNARFLDVRVRLPRELVDLSGAIETAARKRLTRGRCEIGVRAEGAIFSPPTIDKGRASAAYRSLLELRDELLPGAEVPFSMLSAVPDLFAPQLARDFAPTEKAVLGALDGAIRQLEPMREKEGTALGRDLAQRLERIAELTHAVAERAPFVLELYGRKLRERIGRLSAIVRKDEGPTADVVDAGRLEQELVMFAERSDISEELTRLGIHAAQMRDYLGASGPAGRRLDFLLQEMSREINTIGAKSQDTATAHAVVELKTEIERMREQVQNVE